MTSVALSHERCPKCHELGHDRSGDNLAIYSDGHKYCFKCGYYQPGTTRQIVKSKLTKDQASYYGHISNSPYSHLSLPDATLTYKLPTHAEAWLAKYEISQEEIRRYAMCYDTHRDLLILPTYHGNHLVSYTGRYMGSDPKHPKYISKGYKHTYMHVFGPTVSANSPVIFVEDFISAIKVGRQFTTVPLFGTSISTRWFISVSLVTTCLRFWLDFNASLTAINVANRARQWVADSGTIVTEKDPKDYNDKEINEFVCRSITNITNNGDSRIPPEQSTIEPKVERNE